MVGESAKLCCLKHFPRTLYFKLNVSGPSRNSNTPVSVYWYLILSVSCWNYERHLLRLSGNERKWHRREQVFVVFVTPTPIFHEDTIREWGRQIAFFNVRITFSCGQVQRSISHNGEETAFLQTIPSIVRFCLASRILHRLTASIIGKKKKIVFIFLRLSIRLDLSNVGESASFSESFSSLDHSTILLILRK